MAKSASRKRREKQAKKGSGKKPGSEGRKDPPFRGQLYPEVRATHWKDSSRDVSHV